MSDFYRALWLPI